MSPTPRAYLIMVGLTLALLAVAARFSPGAPPDLQAGAKFAHLQVTCSLVCAFFDTRTGDLWSYSMDGREQWQYYGRLARPGEALTQPASSGGATAPGAPVSEYAAQMMADLRNLVTAQEAYFADSVRYTANVSALSYAVSPGATLPHITLTLDGWTATIGHQRTATRCAIFIGSTRIAPATREGEPKCR